MLNFIILTIKQKLSRTWYFTTCFL